MTQQFSKGYDLDAMIAKAKVRPIERGGAFICEGCSIETGAVKRVTTVNDKFSFRWLCDNCVIERGAAIDHEARLYKLAQSEIDQLPTAAEITDMRDWKEADIMAWVEKRKVTL